MKTETRQELFDYMDQEYDISLLETGMEELENIIAKEYREVLEDLIRTNMVEVNDDGEPKATIIEVAKIWERARDLLIK
ncbi:hypothetical protein LCGC14_0536980 [marine sediment metagenome]|uniref:Uncharacterized protein n=1 Tax=marine sediment metagenome TaxID=412755 RepID=A0A0F9V247_9ZZZZ